MSEYLARCALKGVRPKTASALQLVSRPHIVAHLLRERHALRVISAPFGFGIRHFSACRISSAYGISLPAEFPLLTAFLCLQNFLCLQLFSPEFDT